MSFQLSPYAKAKLRLLMDVLIVATLTGFDIRDLVYKINWLGPYDTFRFSATGNNYLEPQKLQLAVNLTASGQELDRPNGWSSFFEKCAHMTALGGGDTFRMVLGQNCTVGSSTFNQTIPNLVLAASVRVDSVAWACCQLIATKRHPSVCSAQLVRGFEDRYYLETVNVPAGWVAKAGSEEEAELLELLDVIGESPTLDRVTCAEGFEYLGPGRYSSTIVGCGSPNVFRSAFAGISATNIRSLHSDKAYLTIDDIRVMGLHYGIRENCISDFVAAFTESGQFYVAYTTIINFSTNGQLYAFQIVNDFSLMVINFMSALQIGSHLVLPAFRSKTPHAVEKFLREGYSSFMTCTLYRSPVIIAMILVSQLLSWLIILPNAVIWTWGEDPTAKVQAYLSSLRLWVFILIAINVLWDLFTFCNEKLAFKIAKYTFLSPPEIIAIGSAISYWNRGQIFGIAEQKWALEHQRQVDSTSFHGYAGVSNAYNPELDTLLNTPTRVLWIIYTPLFTILFRSLLAVCGYAALKFCYFYWTPFGKKHRRRDYLVTVEKTTNSGHDAASLSEKTVPDDKLAQTTPRALKAKRVESSTRSLGTFIHFSQEDRSFVDETSAAGKGEKRKGYAQLPLERLLNTPIRARSLIRGSLELDHIVNHERFVSAHLYLEFGVYFVEGRMKSRWGFLNPIPPIIQVDNTVISDMIQPLTPEELLSRLRSAAKKK